MLDLLLDTLIDAAKMLPFLFLALPAGGGGRAPAEQPFDEAALRRGQGGLFGRGRVGHRAPSAVFPPWRPNLYAGRVITLGTLLSVFIATSDEAFLVLLASPRALPPWAR